jgi:hypothetical protein
MMTAMRVIQECGYDTVMNEYTHKNDRTAVVCQVELVASIHGIEDPKADIALIECKNAWDIRGLTLVFWRNERWLVEGNSYPGPMGNFELMLSLCPYEERHASQVR